MPIALCKYLDKATLCVRNDLARVNLFRSLRMGSEH